MRSYNSERSVDQDRLRRLDQYFKALPQKLSEYTSNNSINPTDANNLLTTIITPLAKDLRGILTSPESICHLKSVYREPDATIRNDLLKDPEFSRPMEPLSGRKRSLDELYDGITPSDTQAAKRTSDPQKTDEMDVSS